MLFAILFVIAFLVGLTAYLLTGKWLTATLISTGLFVLNTVTDVEQSEHVIFTLVLGLPVVFFASLLGAYVVELRRGFGVDDIEHEQMNDDIQTDSTEVGKETEK